MHALNPIRIGLIVGMCVTILHIVWTILIALGWAQIVLDFALWAHSVNNPFVVEMFDFKRASILLCFVFIIGFGAGFMFGNVWNYVHGKKNTE